jgi:hypothetical protein
MGLHSVPIRWWVGITTAFLIVLALWCWSQGLCG